MNSGKNINTEVAPAVKNFNAFDVLVPEKVNTIIDKNESTALLVDLSDSTNNTGNLLDIPQELQGSFVDEKKLEYDLLDLFQNIYVTPQQVKCKVSQVDNVSEEPNIDYTGFFEKLESGQKIDWTKCDDNESKVRDSLHFTKTLENTKNQSKTFGSHNIDNVPHFNGTRTQLRFEEIIDRAVSSQTLKLPQQKLVSKIELENDRLDQKFEGDKDEFLSSKPLLFTKDNMHNMDGTILSDVTDEKTLKRNKELKSQICLKNNSKESLPPIKNLPCGASYDSSGINSTKSDRTLHPASSRTAANKHSIDGIFAINIKYVTGQHHSRSIALQKPISLNIYKNEIKSSITDLNSPQRCYIDQKKSIPVLQTVKKDNKIYLKRRIVKKDSEKISFTKGPCIYEKSVVLPQIMQRLAERKKALDEQNNFKRKMKLDSGVRNNSTEILELPVYDMCDTHIEFSPEVLMEDCKKERLKALKIRTAFETFINTGKFTQ